MGEQEQITIQPIEQLISSIGANKVFGKPTADNGVVVIPVAQAAFGFGYGSSSENGASPSSAEGGHVTEHASERDGGGGGGGHAAPRGYIRISGDDVTYEPIVDETKIPLAAIALAAWTIFWITATVRVIARSVAKTKQMQLKQK